VGTALLLALPRLPAGGVLGVALLLALGCGSAYREQIRLAGQRTAQPVWAHIPAEQWQGVAVLRATGWAADKSAGRRQIPAVILARGPGRDPVGPVPRPGQGVLLKMEGPAPIPGSVFTARVKLRPPGRSAMPGGFSDRRYLLGKGLVWRGWVDEHRDLPAGPGAIQVVMAAIASMRENVLGSLEARLPPPEAALAGAVLTGHKSPLAQSGSAPFVDLGLAHLFALSGLHVGILVGIVLLLPTILGVGPSAKLIGLLPVLAVYGLLTGAPGSVVRAAGLLSLSMAAVPFARRGDPLRHLGLLFLVTSVWMPWQLLDVGSTLSYLAAGGILAMGPALQDLQKNLPGLMGWVAVGLGVSLAAQWFTLPVVAASFGRLNAWSLAANLVVVPYFALVVWLTVLVLVTGWWPWAAAGFAAWDTVAWRGLLVAVHPASSRAAPGLMTMATPGGALWLLWLVGTAGILVVVYRMRRRKMSSLVGAATLGFILLAVLFSFVRTGRDLSPHNGPVAWQVDVEQGDCAVLAFPDGWRCVIDTGGRLGMGPGSTTLWERSLGPYLRRQGIAQVDLVVLSHGHLDHTGGAGALAEEMGVGAWLCGGRAFPPAGGRPLIVRQGEVLHRWQDWDLTLLQVPEPADETLSENDHSLLIALRREGQPMMLWGGDQEKAGEARFVAGHPDFAGTQAWKAGHHGSDTSGSGPFVARIRPRLCLISCGVGNRYLHPRHGPYVVDGDTVPTVRTDCSGSIRLAWDKTGGLAWRTLYGGGGFLPAP